MSNSRRKRMGEWIKRRVDVLHPTATSSNSEHLTWAATLDSHAAINIAALATTPVNPNQTELGWVEINLPTANATSDQGNQPWAALSSTLKALKLTSKAFPPLEAIATQLLDFFDDMKSTEKYRNEYLDLAKSLERTLRRLNEHIPLANPGGMSDEVNKIVSEIQGQIDNIKKQKNHGTLRRMVQVRKDTDELMRCHRQIEVLFAQLQVDLSIGTRSIVDETLVDSRLRGIGPAYEATYNSIQSMDVKRRACTENTRVAVLAEIWDWILQSDGPKIFWMNGMAGTGKTTIAYTTCTQLEANNQLGANFFCSRTLPGCRDVGRVIPTIAYQLARFFPPFRSQLCQILADDPDASTRDLTTQFRKLLKEPMKLVKDIIPNNIVVLIDALDELDGPSSARLFLKLLFENAGGMPVRFFVTSRPDHGLYDAIMSQGSHMRNVFHLHEIENSFVQADIGTYLNAELGPLSLPSSQIQQLAEQAGRFFIYAATAVEYLEPSDPEADHGTRLTTLLRLTSEQPNPRQQKIDGLYAAILRAVFEKPNRDPSEIECIKLVLWSAICAQEPLTAASLSKLLKLDNDRQVVIALKPLRSVLHISEHTEHISTLHASFPDFMFNHKRSGDYACNELTHHGLLAERCFELMQNQLRFNICKLESTLSFDRDVPNLSVATDTIISSELFYACQYWGAHLQHSSITDSLVSHVKNLMMYRLLTWMEVLTLKQAISRGESILGGVERWLQDNDTTPNAHQFVHDAWRFVTSFAASPASASTPHIYISALALWHPESLIFKQYSFLIQGCMRIDETSFTYGSPALLATWDNGTGSQMNSIALSPDGSRLVSGDSGFHNTSSMYVWDVRVGSIILRKPIPRSAGVLSVAFSGDGTRIASGCSDRSIYIWDAITGEAVSSLFQLDSKAVCVAFSHDGSRVICGSDDGTIHNLDTMTGRAIVEPFRNHTRTVNSIAVSPDGTHLVSGSDDHTVYVCELRTGSNRGPFVGHTGAVLSVAYSPCGTRVASGSADRMIRIWNVLTGDAQVTFGPWTIGRRTGTVCSVAFSPNGSRIVSGLGDYAIYVWDSVTGQMVAGPFQGSSAPVNAVVVAPDSTRIFSCSSDGTIGVWDLRSPTTTSVVKRKGHSAPIRGLVASRTGGLIFSLTKIGEVGTWDVLDGSVVELTTSLRGELNSEINTLTFIPSSLNNNRQIVATHIGSNISVWNVSTGKRVAGPFQGHTGQVHSAAISPNGRDVITGSEDNTIRVWMSIVAAIPQVKLLQGHSGGVMSVAFSPDGDYVASGSKDSLVFLWDLRGDHSSWHLSRWFEGHSHSVTSVDFSPKGTHVVSGSTDCTIRIWDVIAGVSSKTPGVIGSHPDLTYIDCVKFSPNGARIASSSSDYTIWAWDAATARVIAGPFKAHTDRVCAMTFSPDSARIISGSEDHTIRTWNIDAAGVPDAPDSSTDMDAASEPGLLGSWRLEDSGWVIDRTGRPLVWVPKPLRPALGWPCNPLVISTAGSLQLPIDGLLDGRIWQELCQHQETKDAESRLRM